MGAFALLLDVNWLKKKSHFLLKLPWIPDFALDLLTNLPIFETPETDVSKS